jgi:hypothetical protein
MVNRPPIPTEIATSILTKSARRCALCFGLREDLGEKKGQIAHLDHDALNMEEDNLIYLCLEHHDQYDSRTSQSKGLTEGEVKTYRERLYCAVQTGLAKTATLEAELFLGRERARERESEMIKHDCGIFERSRAVMSEIQLMDFLDGLQTDDSYTRKGIEPIQGFQYFFKETGNHYLMPILGEKTKYLIKSMQKLCAFLYQHFFVYPPHFVTKDDCQLCLYPELNVDRNGNGIPEEMARYSKFQEQLDEQCSVVRAVYKDYRGEIKRMLLE